MFKAENNPKKKKELGSLLLFIGTNSNKTQTWEWRLGEGEEETLRMNGRPEQTGRTTRETRWFLGHDTLPFWEKGSVAWGGGDKGRSTSACGLVKGFPNHFIRTHLASRKKDSSKGFIPSGNSGKESLPVRRGRTQGIWEKKTRGGTRFPAGKKNLDGEQGEQGWGGLRRGEAEIVSKVTLLTRGAG